MRRVSLKSVRTFARQALAAAVVLAASAAQVRAQESSQRGFLEGRGFWFPQDAPNDPVNLVGDALFRQEGFWRPARWFEAAAGVDVRANSHDQVEDQWRFDWEDRGVQRPRIALRRLSATVNGGGFAMTVGKQFIRWGRADILNPTDRFAPRDYMNVIDTELLPVFAVHPSWQIGPETFEAVWSPHFTPARLPLVTQRWVALSPEAAAFSIEDRGSVFPTGSQYGVRWTHTGSHLDAGLSYFDGFNYLPNLILEPTGPSSVALTRMYPQLRSYGAELTVPTAVVSLKGETAYLKSPGGDYNDFVLYVIELERQTGEWVFDGGYIGEVITNTVPGVVHFAPDEGMAKSIIGHASYTVDPRRTVSVDAAVRQTGSGFFVRGEFSQAVGGHWRFTFDGVALGGEDSDFLGQYRRNSHVSVALRFSY